jgi:hypothetical protein
MNFQLKKPQVIYKLEKGSSRTISNSKMTDELAIKFLKINEDRIKLFSKYPENWLELIQDEDEEDDIEIQTENISKVPGEGETETKTTSKRKAKRKPCTGCKKKITKKDNTDGK